MEFYNYTATEGIEKIRQGDLTAEEWVKSCLARIKMLEPQFKAWAFLNDEIALRQARAADEKRLSDAGGSSCFGVPIGVKDIFNTYDMPTRRGSSIYENYQPKNDARVVSSIRWSQGVVIGKTASDEFAVHFSAKTANPHNINHTPGGSSSGSAAAVASGMVPLALASQTLGSTVRPASYCGIYGFKPSFGLIPRTGMFKTTDTLDHVGLMARSIEDIRFFLDMLRLKGPNHPFIQERVDCRKIKSKSSPWRVALLVPPRWVDAEGHVATAIQDFAERIAGTGGATIEFLQLPALFEEAPRVHETIYHTCLSYYFKEEYQQKKEQLSDSFQNLVRNGLEIPNAVFLKALDCQNLLTRKLDDLLAPYDALLTFTSSSEAPQAQSIVQYKPDPCLIWTLCHVPALSVPAFTGKFGLPFGFKVVARKYDDYGLLDFVAWLKERGLVKNATIVPDETVLQNAVGY